MNRSDLAMRHFPLLIPLLAAACVHLAHPPRWEPRAGVARLAAAPADPYARIKARLAVLDRLRADHTISTAEYQRRRDAILDREGL